MKSFYLSVGLVLFVLTGPYAQSYDDGLVSSQLSVNTSESRFVSFVSNFRSGFSRVRNMELTSADGIASLYGVDIRNYPKIDQVVNNASWGSYNGDFTPVFLSNIKDQVDKTGEQYESFGELRSGLLGMAQAGNLSSKESAALALIDIAIQEIKKEVIDHDLTYGLIPGYRPVAQTQALAGPNFPDYQSGGNDAIYDDYKLPGWAKCVLGVLGSAIFGGFTGATAGAKFGIVFGPGGAATGAAIGGIVGVIGGAFTGAASFCD